MQNIFAKQILQKQFFFSSSEYKYRLYAAQVQIFAEDKFLKSGTSETELNMCMWNGNKQKKRIEEKKHQQK